MHTVEAARRLLMAFFARHDPARATSRDVEDFLYQPLTRRAGVSVPLSPTTRNLRRSVLSSFYRYASTFPVYSIVGPPLPLFRGIAPTAHVKLAKVPHHYRPFTRQELARFFAVIPTDTVIGLRDRAMFLFLFYSARRRAEVCSLQWGDIEQALFPDGKGGTRAGWRYRFSGKGKAGEYEYRELAEPVRLAIWQYLEAAGRIHAIERDDPLFLPVGPAHGGLPIDPYKPMSAKGMYAAMKRYLRIAGLDPALSPHSFRHTSALMRYQVQPDPRAVMYALDHADLRVTTHYLDDLVPHGDEALRLLEEMLGEWL